MMLFFIFTGAPNTALYEHFSRKKRFFFIVKDGIVRYLKLTAGIWNDDTAKSYIILGRSERYEKEMSVTGHENKNKMSVHEQVVQLIAYSRGVLWIPLPLCVTIAKLSEHMNSAVVFSYFKTEKLYFKRAIWVRVFTWATTTLQMPIIYIIIVTAKTWAVGLLAASCLPVFFLTFLPDLRYFFLKLYEGLTEYMPKIEEIDLNDLKSMDFEQEIGTIKNEVGQVRTDVAQVKSDSTEVGKTEDSIKKDG